MLYVIERKRPIRTLRGWAISTLQDAGAIRQCEYHGWLGRIHIQRSQMQIAARWTKARK